MFNTPPSPYDVSFRFLGFAVRVHPLFWIIFLFLGAQWEIPDGNLGPWLCNLAILIAAVFVSILVHELGHALVFRHVLHVPSSIVLHGFGGATMPHYPHRRQAGVIGLLNEVLLSAAGPLAEFLLAGVLGLFLFLLQMTGTFNLFPEKTTILNMANPASFFVVFMLYTTAISVIWGVFNLLPIYPMDGGHIVREIFAYFSPRNGIGHSLMLSMLCAVLLAVLAFQYGQIFIVLLMAYFAYQNYSELSSFRT